MNFDDGEKLKDLGNLLSKGKDTKYPKDLEPFIPAGTKQTTSKKGVITWYDPITECAMTFHNIHFRNAWIIIQIEKGVFAKEVD